MNIPILELSSIRSLSRRLRIVNSKAIPPEMSNVIFVISVSSLPDPLSSRFVGFKYFMQEEFFLLSERRMLPSLCSSQLHSFGSSSACEGLLAGITRDLHGMAASVRTSALLSCIFHQSYKFLSASEHVRTWAFLSPKQFFFLAVTFAICLTKHLAENTQEWTVLVLSASLSRQEMSLR